MRATRQFPIFRFKTKGYILFDAWKKAGMNLGTHDYQVLSTEGYNNAAGSTNQKTTTGAAPPATTST